MIIHEIPEEQRIRDREILMKAVEEGRRAQQEGRYFHPAANGKIDQLTAGYSSEIQLRSLLENARLAERLV